MLVKDSFCRQHLMSFDISASHEQTKSATNINIGSSTCWNRHFIQNEFGFTVTCVEDDALANNFFIALRLCEYHISPISIKIADMPTVVMQPSLINF